MATGAVETSADALATALDEAAADPGTTTGKETATADKGSETAARGTSKPDKGEWIPKARFDEVIGQKNEYHEHLLALEAEVREAHESLRQSTALLAEREQDTKVMNELRRIANDPKARPLLEKLEKMIEGVEDEIEETKGKPSADQTQLLEALKQTRDELTDELADQRADIILSKADTIAERYLAALPDEYTDADKRVISHLWTPRVDWEAIEENPDVMPQALVSSLEEVLDLYGEPKGIATTTVKEPVRETGPTPEQELAALVNKDYGAFKEVKGESGKTSRVAAVSDDDFAADLARAMKIANGSR